MKKLLETLRGNLVVSCQALEDEPLHSSEIMGRMAKAAMIGGAKGIRANSPSDIREIKKQVDLPVIGIWKQIYEGSEVYITPTLKEVKAVIEAGAEMVALDATDRSRPKETLAEIVSYCKKEAEHITLMADISNTEEALLAEKMGFDCVSTTLVGYTSQTEGKSIFDHDLALLDELKTRLSVPLVAEGKVKTPKQLRAVFDKGVHFAVVGGAITRPQDITKTFTSVL